MSLLADPPLTETVLEPDSAQSSEPADFRLFVLAGIRPAAISLVVTATLLLLTMGAAGAGFADSPAYIAAGWLAVHQVPVQIASDFLGLLPLALTAGLVVLTARTVRGLAGHVRNWRDVAFAIAGMVAGPVLVAVLALVVLSNASIESKLEAPPTLSMLGWVASVHLFGAIVGIRKNLPPLPHRLVPGWVAHAGEATRFAVRLLLAAGLIASIAVAIVRWDAVEASLASGNGAGGALALTIVSLLYLPNLMVFAAAVISGSAVTLGDGSVALFEVAQGQVPSLPIMAALPDGPAEPWWQAVLLVPLLVAILAGRKCARLAGARGAAIRTALVTALMSAVVAYGAAIVSGGTLGAIGYVGLSPLFFAVTVFVWFALFGSLAASFKVKVKVKVKSKVEVKAEPAAREPEVPAEPEVTEEVSEVAETDAEAAESTEPTPEVAPEKESKPGLIGSVVGALPIPFLKK